MDIRQVIYKARQGNSVLFLGAGFSFEARNKFSRRFPNAIELSSEIQGKLSEPYDEILQLKESSEEYIEEFGKEKLYNLI
ncbi:TPA: hypothetical protein OUI92_005407, partial [Klebsiella pneumoniae]|nr:hypothetical protein [Klebsiella pneumoniae]